MQVQVARVSEKKKQEVENIKDLVRNYNVLGILNLENLPADQFIKIKHKLTGKVKIRTTKKRLIKIAFSQLEKEKPGITKLNEMIKGSPALLMTNEDEFKLQKTLNKNKSSAFAKPGQTANKDIEIAAGPTQFTPGPMIGEFGQLGIKTQVLEGKIHIKENKLLVKEGEEINQKTASILSKLGIEPMEIGLNLILTFKNGEILTKEVLDIDEKEFLDSLVQAYHEAINLAVNTSYLTKETIEIVLKKAQLEAMALETKIPNLDSISSSEPETKKEETKEVSETKEEKPEEIKEEEKTESIKEEKINEKKEAEKELKEELKHHDKIEAKPVNAEKDEMQRAADLLRQLTDKKIRGEI
ncbi:MAG: 50S ribosomal protein L10 [Nanoarchaeota archaeon]